MKTRSCRWVVVVVCIFDDNAICRPWVVWLVFFSLNRNRLSQDELADLINCTYEVPDTSLRAVASHWYSLQNLNHYLWGGLSLNQETGKKIKIWPCVPLENGNPHKILLILLFSPSKLTKVKYLFPAWKAPLMRYVQQTIDCLPNIILAQQVITINITPSHT